MRLTKKAIDRLKTEKRQAYFWDDSTGSLRFGVCVYRSGRKVYVFDYRGPDGRRKRMNLCPCEVLPPSEARKLARKMAAGLAENHDPLDERQRAREKTMTLAELWGRFEHEFIDHPRPAHRKGHKPLAQRTRDEYRRLWKKDLVGPFGGRRVDSISQEDIERFHQKIGRESPYLANRLLALLGSMFTFAKHIRLRGIETNPAQGLIRFEEPGRQRFLSSEELSRLGEVLRVASTGGEVEFEKGNPVEVRAEPWQALTALRLLLFTGARKNEVLGMRWDDLDLERGIWNLSKGKGGARAVYLTPPALAILSDTPRLAGNAWVLPACRGKGHFAGLQVVWSRIRAAAGLDDVRLHDVRHSVASEGRLVGLPLGILQGILGHKEARTTERYAHIGASPIQEGAELIAGRIAEALKPKEDRHKAEVVPLAEKH